MTILARLAKKAISGGLKDRLTESAKAGDANARGLIDKILSADDVGVARIEADMGALFSEKTKAIDVEINDVEAASYYTVLSTRTGNT